MNIKKGTKHTTETFGQFVKDMLGNDYELVSTYINSRNYVTLCHKTCGHVYEVQPRRVRMGRKCPECHGNKRKDTSWFTEQVKQLEGNEYEVIGDYVNNKTHIYMRHETCGHQFPVRPAHFLDGRRCPKCRMSKGEKLVGKVLEHFKLHHQPQQKFDDCRHIQRLPFDFGIYTPHGELIALIEFDGQQHYEVVEAFGSEADFKRRIRNDRIKDDYAKAKGIPLLRIAYFETRPKKMMTDFLVSVLMDYHANQASH